VAQAKRPMTYEHGGVTHKGEIRTTTRKGLELQRISKGLDFLILCREGRNRCKISDLNNNLGSEWKVEGLKDGGSGNYKHHEILRDFGSYYWAHRGWDKREKSEWDQYKEFYKDIFQLLGGRILDHEDKAGVWRLVGDERLLDNQKTLLYIWVVIPPNSRLKPEFNYHSSDGDYRRTKRIVKRLIKRGIKIHVFEAPHEPHEADYTHRILPNTIPVMMDIIRTQIEDRGPTKVPLRIIVEGYNSGPSQWGNVTPFESRYNEKADTGFTPNFLKSQSKPIRFLPKDGHPLLAYPDAVGGVIGSTKEVFSATLENLMPLVEQWTFEDAVTLSGGLLSGTNLKNPTEFYRELRELPDDGNLTVTNKSLESIVNYYSKNLVKNLRVEKFIEFEEEYGPDSYQWASDRMTEDGGGIDSWMGKTQDDSYRQRFEICFSGVAQAGRKTDGKNVMKYGEMAIDLIDNHRSKLKEHRIKKFNEVMESTCQRFFIFDWKSKKTLDELYETTMANYSDKDDWNYFGSRLLREAQRDGPQVAPKILQMQKDLTRRQREGRSGKIRDTEYLLEMLIDLAREDNTYLDQALEIHNEYNHEIGDTWGLAAQLKLGVMLDEDGREVPDNICSLLGKLDGLDFGLKDSRDDNPTVRRLAWGARLSHILEDYERRDRLVRILRLRAECAINGEREPLKDSVGVSHACHIFDLEEREWGSGAGGEEIGNDYLKMVRDKSFKNTKNWLDENSQQEGHLSPLNLLHR